MDFRILREGLLSHCHIWQVYIKKDNYYNLCHHLHVLSSYEQQSLNSLKFEQDKNNYISAHVALRKIISYYTEVTAENVNYRYNAFGKPYLTNDVNDSFFFNMSYAHEIAMIAINNSEIGLDVEYIKQDLEIDELGVYVFSSNESIIFKSIDSAQKRLEYFYDTWTQKEAYLKALSIGLINDLHALDLNEKRSKYLIQKLAINHPNYIAHIAFKANQQKKVLYFDFNF
jgi:4'-phosphopantetheinyl transferase